MTVTTDAEELVINKLTKAQYQSIENPSDTELYFITDDKINYNDIENTPTIGSAVITIQKNGNNVDTFSVNDVTDKTINIIVPESVSDLSDGSNYVEASDLSNVSFSGSYDDLINKPTIGDEIRKPDAQDIKRANNLMFITEGLMAIIILLVLVLIILL